MWIILRSLCTRIRSGFWILATCQLYLFWIEVLVGLRWWVWCCNCSFQRSLDSLVALLWTYYISLNGDHTFDAYGILHVWTDESLVEMYKYNSISISLSMYWKPRWIRPSIEFASLNLSAKCLVNWRSFWKVIPRSVLLLFSYRYVATSSSV